MNKMINKSQAIFLLDNGVKFFPGQRILTNPSGCVVHLPENSCRLLNLLMAGVNDKKSIIENVWREQNGVVSDSSYHVQIHALRKTFERIGLSSALIKTIPRKGVEYTGEIILLSANVKAFRHKRFTRKMKGLDHRWMRFLNSHLLITLLCIVTSCWLSSLLFFIYYGGLG